MTDYNRIRLLGAESCEACKHLSWDTETYQITVPYCTKNRIDFVSALNLDDSKAMYDSVAELRCGDMFESRGGRFFIRVPDTGGYERRSIERDPAALSDYLSKMGFEEASEEVEECGDIDYEYFIEHILPDIPEDMRGLIQDESVTREDYENYEDALVRYQDTIRASSTHINLYVGTIFDAIIKPYLERTSCEDGINKETGSPFIGDMTFSSKKTVNALAKRKCREKVAQVIYTNAVRKHYTKKELSSSCSVCKTPLVKDKDTCIFCSKQRTEKEQAIYDKFTKIAQKYVTRMSSSSVEEITCSNINEVEKILGIGN